MTRQLVLDKETLLSVKKPARYIGGEVGCANKDLSRAAVRVCLAFPDIYEIGMSHLGLRILYDVINRHPDYAADRVFLPWVDMEEKLKEKEIPLFALESQATVRSFDILGFSIQYELSYANILHLLSLCGIPLASRDRGEDEPLIIGGGVCCLNPEPLADFFDLFVVGEAEEAILDILAVVRAAKSKGLKKADVLRLLCGIKGVYVPFLYDGQDSCGDLKPLMRGAPRRIAKRYVRDLERVMEFSHWVVPFIEIVHDRIGIEIMRGCPHGCRFCQAYASFYPLRVIRKDKVLSLVRRLYAMTGYEEISLLSLSSSDHPHLAQIVRTLAGEFKDKGVSIALPSLRANTCIGELSEVFATMRKTTLTFAPEAGSQAMRDALGKNLKEDDIFQVARRSYTAGYRALKLYFMIGLPGETEKDLRAIASFCIGLSLMKKEVDGHPAKLNVTISNFVPKPHTPLESAPMCSPEALIAKQEFLRGLLRAKRGFIHLKFNDPYMSALESVLARGARACGRMIARAHAAGARFDAWNEHFRMDIWREAAAQTGVDMADEADGREIGAALPWDFVETGVPGRAGGGRGVVRRCLFRR